MRIKAWLRLHWSWLWQRRSETLTILFGVLLLIQTANGIAYIAANTHHEAIIASSDDDAGWVIGRTVATRWWKDNGSAVYGPAFFRAAHTIHYFLWRTAAPSAYTDHEVWQKTAHFSALLISQLSVLIMALLLASLITSFWAYRFLIAIGLQAAFWSHPVWVNLILRAHPDFMFTAVSLGAFVLMVRMLAEPERRLWFVGSALLWGVATATKLSTAPLVFGFFAIFMPPFTKESMLRALRYAGYMFLGYFAIGFPQTIVLDRPFRDILSLKNMNQPMSWGSTQQWIEQFTTQPVWPMVIVLAATLLLGSFSSRDHVWYRLTLSRSAWLRLALFVLIPLIIVFTRNMIVINLHYPIPYLTLWFALWALILVNLSGALLARVRQRVPEILRIALFGTLVLAGVGVTPQTLSTQLAQWEKCRDQYEAAYRWVQDALARGHNVWVDPYFPYDRTFPKERIDRGWAKNWDEAKGRGFTAFGINTNYMSTYLHDDDQISAWVTKTMKSWRSIRDFYRAFQGDEFISPNGDLIRRTYANDCNQEFWEQVSKP